MCKTCTSFTNPPFSKSTFYKSMFYKSTFYKSPFYKSMFYKSTFYKSMFYKSTFYKSMFYKSSPCFTNPIQSIFYNIPFKTYCDSDTIFQFFCSLSVDAGKGLNLGPSEITTTCVPKIEVVT